MATEMKTCVTCKHHLSAVGGHACLFGAPTFDPVTGVLFPKDCGSERAGWPNTCGRYGANWEAAVSAPPVHVPAVLAGAGAGADGNGGVNALSRGRKAT